MVCEQLKSTFYVEEADVVVYINPGDSGFGLLEETPSVVVENNALLKSLCPQTQFGSLGESCQSCPSVRRPDSSILIALPSL